MPQRAAAISNGAARCTQQGRSKQPAAVAQLAAGAQRSQLKGAAHGALAAGRAIAACCVRRHCGLLLAAPLLSAAARCGLAAARGALRDWCLLRAAALLRADADCAIASCQIGARIAARCAIAV
jgi:hypothetical protein